MATFNGTMHNDVYSGTDGADTITGNLGDDILRGRKGNDLIKGDAGNDALYGDEGNDQIEGGDGNDYIEGGSGLDKILGGIGIDTIDGGDNDDDISGGTGNDWLKGGSGNDLINGDEGDDKIEGGSGNDKINGGSGNDAIFAGSGNDTVDGGTGNDYIEGGSGNDTVDGGDGNDVIHGDGQASETGNDLVRGGAGNDTVFGCDGNDTVDGGSGNDSVYGDNGNDLVIGRIGNDRIEGGSGNDTAQGDAGNDTIYGNDGNDLIIGGAGIDTMTGGSGRDTYKFFADDSPFVAKDVIKDFAHNIDKIDLREHGNVLGAMFYRLVDKPGVSGGVFNSITEAKQYLSSQHIQFDGIVVKIKDGTIVGFGDITGNVNWAVTVGSATIKTITASDFLFAAPPSTNNQNPDAVNDTNAGNEDTTITGSVAGNDSDPDGDALTFALNGAAPAGFTLGSNGAYSLNAANTAYQSLAAGVQAQVVANYTASDGKGGSDTAAITITVTGVNDTAVIAGTATDTVKEDVDLTASGKLNVTDADAGQSTFVPQTNVQGTYGTFAIDAAGNWTYALDNNAVQSFAAQQQYIEYFTVQSADGSATRTVAVTINGTNDPASLPTSTVDLVESDAPLATGGQLSVNDVDTGEAGFLTQVSVPGTYGTFSIDVDGNWTYTTSPSAHNEFDAGTTYSDIFSVASFDGTLTSVTINILGTNDGATLSSDVRNLTETDSAADISSSGQLTVSDVDSDEAFRAQTTDGLYGKFTLLTSGDWTYAASSAHNEFQAGQVYTDVFQVFSADGTPTSVTINVTGSDEPPVNNDPVAVNDTNAGNENTFITGQAVASDPDGDAVTFATNGTVPAGFSITSAGVYTLDTNNAAYQHLAAGVSTDEIAGFRATDNKGGTDAGSTGTITITVVGVNDVATITGVSTDSVKEDVDLIAGGKLNVTDVDDGQSTFVPQTDAPGTYGTFNIDLNGNWTYALDNNAVQQFGANHSETETFTVLSADGSASRNVVVTINGTNDPAIITSAQAILTETDAALTTNGQLNFFDIDIGENGIQAQTDTAGLYGKLSVTIGGAVTYTMDSAHSEFVAGQIYTDVFTVLSLDGTPTSVTVTITGTNDGATVSSDVRNLTETDAAVDISSSGMLTVSDVDSSEIFQAQTTIGLYGTFTLLMTGAWTYAASSAHNEFEAGTTYTDIFTVHTADGTPSSVTINIAGTDEVVVPPISWINAQGQMDFSAAGFSVDINLPISSIQQEENQPPSAVVVAGTVDATNYFEGGLAIPGLGTPTQQTYIGSAFSDRIIGNDVVEQLYGGAGNDEMAGNGGADVIEGGDGNDFITGGAGNDVIDGQDGDDRISGGNDDDNLVGRGGNDIIHGDDGADTIYGDGGETGSDDQLFGDAGNDTINGGSGADIISGGNDNDSLFGDDGNDTIGGNLGNDEIQGGAGEDQIFGGAGTDTLSGGADGDSIDGGDDNDGISGGAGADFITGGAGDDSIVGDDGNDTIQGGAGIDTINGGNDADSIDGGDDNDVLRGNAGADVIFGGAGNDDIDAGEGDNPLILGNDGADTIMGGSGRDIIYGGTDVVSATDDGDLIFAGAGNDEVYGGGGDDGISGGDGADLIIGGAGDDIIGDVGTPEAGNDTIDGGDGDDVIFAGADNDSVTGGIGEDLILGGDGNDTIDGGADSDSLHGGEGNDTIIGGDGVDALEGDAGDDNLSGGDGLDSLNGGEGNDTIDGGFGDDLLTGGGGADTFIFDAGDSVGSDVILDFTHGEDKIDLRTFVNPGGQGFFQLVTSPTSGDGNFGNPEQALAYLIANGIPVGGTLIKTDDRIIGFGDETGLITLSVGIDNGTALINVDDFHLVAGPTPPTDPWKDQFGNADFTAATASVDLNTVTNVFQFEENTPPLTNVVGGSTYFDGGNTIAGFTAAVTSKYILSDFSDRFFAGSENSLAVHGVEGNDFLTGGSGNNQQLYGGDGQDTLTSGATATDTTLVGEAGNDTLIGNDNRDFFQGGDGTDQITGNGGNDQMHGGADGDVLRGNAGEDIIYGDGGTDTLIGGTEDDQLYGGADNDQMFGEAGNDVIYGEEGFDNIFGQQGADFLYGGTGGDTISGSDGANDDGAQDIFYYVAGDSTLITPDTINQFKHNEDKFDLRNHQNVGGTDFWQFVTNPNDANGAFASAADAKDYMEANDILVAGSLFKTAGSILGFSDEAGTISWAVNVAASQIGPINGLDFFLSVAPAETWFDINQNINFTKSDSSVDALIGAFDSTFQLERDNDPASTAVAPADVATYFAGGDLIPGLKPVDSDHYVIGSKFSDRLIATADNSRAYFQGGEGDDYLKGSTQADYLLGDAGDDHIEGNGGYDQVYDYNGNNTIILEDGQTQTGIGDDTITFTGNQNAYVNDDGGNNVIKSTGTSADQIYLSGAGDNVVDTGGGNDVIQISGLGDNIIKAGGGNDSLYIYGSDDIDLADDTATERTDALRYYDYGGPEHGIVRNFEHGVDEFHLEYIGPYTGIQPQALHTFIANPTSGTNGVFSTTSEALAYLRGNNMSSAGVVIKALDGIFGFNATEETIFHIQIAEMTTLNAIDATDMILSAPPPPPWKDASGNAHFEEATSSVDINLVTNTFQFETDNTASANVLPAAADAYFSGGETILDFTPAAPNQYYWGSDFSDRMLGNDGFSYFTGGAGNDYLSAGSGYGQLMGEDGDDVLTGGSSNYNWLYGGAGNDTITNGNNGGQLIGNEGNDTIIGGTGADVLQGGADNDLINAGDGNDAVYGESGDDFLNGGTGADQVYGGEGIDNIQGGDGDDFDLDGQGGNDTVGGDAGNDTVKGGTGDDIVTGGFGADHIWGDAGADTLQGAVGGNTVDGDVDTFHWLTGDSIVGSRDTILQFVHNEDKIDLTQPFNGVLLRQLVLNPTAGSNGIFATNAAALTFLNANGGATGKIVKVADGLTGFTDNAGTIGWTVIMAAAQLATLTESDFNIIPQWLDAQGKANFTNATSSIDLDTGTGIYQLETDNSPALANVLPAGADSYFSGGAVIQGFNGAVPQPGGNPAYYIGSNFSDKIAISGGAVYTIVNSGAGNDYLSADGTKSSTQLYGEGGDDVIHGTNMGTSSYLDGGDGNDIITLDGTSDTFTNMYGQGGNDTITGSAGREQIYGHDGNDILVGGGGDSDYIDGGIGNDQITGGALRDTIVGGDGNDTISAGAGVDNINGGAGADIIDTGAGADLVTINSGHSTATAPDTLTGFTHGEDDLDVRIGAVGTGMFYFAANPAAGSNGIFASAAAAISYLQTNNLSLTGTLVKLTDGIYSFDSTQTVDFKVLVPDAATLQAIDATDFVLDTPPWGFTSGGPINIDFSTSPNFSVDINIGTNTFQAEENTPALANVAPADVTTYFSGGGAVPNFNLLYYPEYSTVWGSNFSDRMIASDTKAVVLNGWNGDDYITGGALGDNLQGYNGNDIINGGLGNDTIDGGAGNDIIDGGDGNNFLFGGSGNDQITAGSGNDTISLSGGTGIINAGDGTNNITFGSGTNQINGGSGVDNVNGSGGILTINTFGGDDRLFLGYGSSGTATVDLGDGANYVELTLGNDTVVAGSGNDTIWASGGSDNITAGAGDDTINADNASAAQQGADIINAGAGADIIDGGGGADTIMCGIDANGDVVFYNSFALGSKDAVSQFNTDNDIFRIDLLTTAGATVTGFNLSGTHHELTVQGNFTGDAALETLEIAVDTTGVAQFSVNDFAFI